MEDFEPTPRWKFWILWIGMAIYLVAVMIFLEYTGL